MSSTREEPLVKRDEGDGESISSDSASDLSLQGVGANKLERGRSYSFDDLYSLAPAQDGLSANSKFAYIPLLLDPPAIPKSASYDDLTALAEEYADTADDFNFRDDDGSVDFGDDGASVMSMPSQIITPKHKVSRRAMSVGDAHDRSEIEPADEDIAIAQDDTKLRKGSRQPAARSSTKTGLDDDSPAVRLFGKERAQQLRERIRKGRNVTKQEAEDALNAATAALVGTGNTEMIEFVTWFTVWLLIMFYLLFYSSYGPMLWRLLYGPMGILLALPFSFALLFWLIRYILTEDDEEE